MLEREEKAIRIAEMEATKLGNLMMHEDEIKSRPARTWFQSAMEKEEAKAAALEALADVEEVTPIQYNRVL